MARFLLAAVLGAVSVAPAAAQSPENCLPDLSALIYGPEPIAPTSWRAPGDTTGRADVLGRADRSHQATGAAARGSDAACATRSRTQALTSGAWVDVEDVLATYAPDGQTLSVTDRSAADGGLQNRYRSTYGYTAGRLDSVVSEERSYRTGQLERSGRTVFLYDASGHVAQYSDAYWSAGDWIPVLTVSLTYGSGPYATGELKESAYEGGPLLPSSRSAISYTPENSRLVTQTDEWSGATWTPALRQAWSYTGLRPDAFTLTGFDASGSVERGLERTLYAYEGDRVASKTKERLSASGTWVPNVRIAFTYHPDGTTASWTRSYAAADGTFRLSDRLRYEQDAGDLLTAVFLDVWTGTAWDVRVRSLYSRDSAGRTTEILDQGLDGTAWASYRRQLFSYGDATAADGTAPAAGGILRAPAPNPTGGRSVFTFALDAAGPARLSVVDALGREVTVLFDGPAAAGETTATFDGSALPAGVYAARLSAGGRVETQRVTVVR